MRTRTTLTALLTATGVTAAALITAPGADAAARLSCSVKLNTHSPRQYSTVNVAVHTAASASITTAAHYKTTTNTKHAKANRSGNATINYYISGATKNRKIPLTVAVTKGSAKGACTTSFTPH
jgi:hypothetical protein